MDNRKKVIILAVVSIVAVAAIAIIATSMFVKNRQSSDIPTVDQEKHTGIAQALTVSQVNDALGDLGKGAKEPELSGTLNTEQLRGETASYKFTTLNGKTARVDVEVRIFSNAEAMKRSEPFKETENEKIEGTGADEARYFIPRSFSADEQVAVIATKGNKTFKFSVMQDANEGIDINQMAGKKIVYRLAQAAKYDTVK